MAYDLERFVAAQDAGGTYQQALTELRAGYKSSHWMWFVFPQIEGLGRSGMARRYAVTSLDEARAYLEHPVLGARLVECLEALDGLADATAVGVFGSVDAMKLRSSLTLFRHAAPQLAVVERVLDTYFDGVEDPETTRRLPAD